MISVEEARARILAPLTPTPPETVALAEAWNRVLARPVQARLTQPPAAVSAMDGYAVRAADAVEGATLRVIGSAPAGHPFASGIAAGEALRIFTGSVIPDGADGVLLQEDAEAQNNEPQGNGAQGNGAQDNEARRNIVLVRETVRAGRWIRPQGLDFAEGETLLAAGRRLTARDIGLAAAANHPWLVVHQAPVVGILATGDEIALPGDPIPPGGIVSSNAHALAALVRASGGQPRVLPIAPDDEDAIAQAAAAALRCDILVTTGGASVGDHDLVQKALGPAGFTLDFWKIAMRPGKPLIWGRLGQTPVLGLPGNPVSALVCATVFLLPALEVLQGRPAAPPPTLRATTTTDLPENDKRFDHLRASLQQDAAGNWHTTAFAKQDSSMLATLARADGLILRDAFAPAVPAGTEVAVIPLSGRGL